jgi:hypothetical protein
MMGVPLKGKSLRSRGFLFLKNITNAHINRAILYMPTNKRLTKSIFSVVREYACSHEPSGGHRMTEKTSWTEPRGPMTRRVCMGI